MRIKLFAVPVFFVLLLLGLLGLSTLPSTALSETEQNPSVMFIENVGQFDAKARFQVRGGNGTMWLADDALWLTLLESAAATPAATQDYPFPKDPFPYQAHEAQSQIGVNIKLSFVGANPTLQIEPFDRRGTSINYFVGNDANQWHTDVPAWGGVRYVEMYPGVDLELSGTDGQLRPRLVCQVNCQTALQQVHLQVEGADTLQLVENQFVLTTTAGDFVFPAFMAVTTDDLNSTTYSLTPHLESNTISFRLSVPLSDGLLSQTLTHPLTNLLYGTFLGGSDEDVIYEMTIDNTGHAYLTGVTYSSDFPTTPGPFDPTYNGNRDAFVVKLNPTGNDLVYATFLGGDVGEEGFGVTVDAAGSAYVAGWTSSANFPTTPGVFDTTPNGYLDVFVVKLNPGGNALIYATLLGGNEFDEGRSIAISETGQVFVTGYTASTDFPATPGAYDTTHDGSADIFVARFNADASDLVYATYLGGESYENTVGMVIDEMGNAYVTGATYSFDFPTTPGAYDTIFNGGDGILVKLNPTGSNLVYATFLGGSNQDSGSRVTIDESGHAYVAGGTFSANFPTTPGAYDTGFNGNEDAFVVKFNPAGSGLIYATYLGSTADDTIYDIVLDGTGHAYLTGLTNSANFPTTPGAYDPTHNGSYDAFMVTLNPTGSDLVYATFLGGSGFDTGFGIALDGAGSIYVGGRTASSDFPTTPGAFDTTYNGGLDDIFALKLASIFAPVQAGFSGTPTSGVAPLNVAFTNLSTGDFDSCLWQFGDGATSANCNDPDHTFMTPGTYTVTLTVSGLGGMDTVVQPAFITFYEAVQAEFAAAPTSGYAPLLVQFTNLSIGDFTSCIWDFGDGAGSTECENTTHIYEASGMYTVTLALSGPGGSAIETKPDYVTVGPHLLFLPLLTRPQ